MSIQIRNKFTILAAPDLLTLKNAMTSFPLSTRKKNFIIPAVAAVSARC